MEKVKFKQPHLLILQNMFPGCQKNTVDFRDFLLKYNNLNGLLMPGLLLTFGNFIIVIHLPGWPNKYVPLLKSLIASIEVTSAAMSSSIQQEEKKFNSSILIKDLKLLCTENIQSPAEVTSA